jgi:uncharacterized iron-regulated membrane protein
MIQDSEMRFWNRWLKHPQSLGLRKALFQVHLWTGIGLGLYVLLVCVSGSAIVFESELFSALTPGPRIVAISGARLSRAELKQAAQRAYPNDTVTQVRESRIPNEAAEVFLQHNGKRNQRLFDPYTGIDLGPARPKSLLFLGWLAQLHMSLLSGYTGRIVNGFCALFVTLLCLTGAVVWWPGVQSWRSSLTIHGKANFKRLNWDLHSAIGFWTLAFVFMWAITGAYLVFPKPFDRGVDFFSSRNLFRAVGGAQAASERSSVGSLVPANNDGNRTKRVMAASKLDLRSSIRSLHLGNFGGWPVKALWVVLGLAPAFLAVTGVLMWWNRVVNPRLAVRRQFAQSRTGEAEALRTDRSRDGSQSGARAPLAQ